MKNKILKEIAQIKKMMGLKESMKLPSEKMDKIEWNASNEEYVKVYGQYVDTRREQHEDFYGFVPKSSVDSIGGVDETQIEGIEEYFPEPDDNYIYNQGDYEGGIKYGPKDDGRHLK